MSSRKSQSSSRDDLGYRRILRPTLERDEDVETSLFGSPVRPERPSSAYSYRGPKGTDRVERRAFYNESALGDSSRPSSRFSEAFLEGDNLGLLLGDDLTGLNPDRFGKRSTSRLSERDITEFDDDDTPTGSRPPSRYSMAPSEVSRDVNDELDDKYLEYRRRHFSEEYENKLEERKTRLPSYDNELLHSYQRSFVRQADLVKDADVLQTHGKRHHKTESMWETFPTVEDLDGCYLVEKQFEVALDPNSEYPDMPDWMGLYHGQDGVYTLNKGLSHMPLTGKSAANHVERIRDGVKMLVVYRPPHQGKGDFGFKITVMDSGVYVIHIEAEGPAVRGGLKYGDQILRIGQAYCSGMLHSHVEGLIEESGDELILFVRDRPNEKMYTLLRDSNGYFGFRIRGAQIIEVVKGSSAARNGIPTNHFITEINGQNVVGWNDDRLRTCMDGAAVDGSVTFTLLHERAYKDLVRDLGDALFSSMDHSLNFSIPVPKIDVDSFEWNPTAMLHRVTEKTSLEN